MSKRTGNSDSLSSASSSSKRQAVPAEEEEATQAQELANESQTQVPYHLSSSHSFHFYKQI